MRRLTFWVCLAAAFSCGNEQDQQRNEAQEPVVPKRPAPSASSQDIGGHDPCRRTERIELAFDGGTLVLDVPVPCDPLWHLKDMGDPPFGL